MLHVSCCTFVLLLFWFWNSLQFPYVKNCIRFGYLISIFLLRWAIQLAVEIDGANLQLHDVNICVKVCFGNLATITLPQNLRLKLFLSMFPVPNISTLAILIRQEKSSQNAPFRIPRMNFLDVIMYVASVSGKTKAHKLKKNLRDTGGTNRGLPSGVPGISC